MANSKLEGLEVPLSVRWRDFLSYFGALGLGGTLFPGVLQARTMETTTVTEDMLAGAERVAGLEATDASGI